MRKLLGAITIAAMLLIGGVPANANPNVAHLAGQGPNDGEFSAWTKQMANGEQIKFYAKYLQPGQKVQFMVQNSAGSYVQYAWKRVETEDLNSDGSYQEMQNHIYFIRTLDLKPGKNRVRILVDGEIVWGTKTYSRNTSNPPASSPDREYSLLEATFNFCMRDVTMMDGWSDATLYPGNKTIKLRGVDRFDWTDSGVKFKDVRCIGDRLGMTDYVYDKIGATNSLMGLVEASWPGYSAYWTYHPDPGLNLTITEN